MRGENRLGTLKMGVAGQDHAGIAVAAADEGLLDFEQSAVDLVDGSADPKAEVGGDLIVSAAGGMQFSANVANPLDQRPLDVHVDIFQLDAKLELLLLDF